MILVDTNVVSETMRLAPEQKVVDWLDAQVAETLYLTTVSLAELLFGVAVLPEGKRKVSLGFTLVEKAALLFGERVLPFDIEAAKAYAAVMSRCQRAGRRMGTADAQIAAIAAIRGLKVATRDTVSFQAAGLKVVDPWN